MSPPRYGVLALLVLLAALAAPAAHAAGPEAVHSTPLLLRGAEPGKVPVLLTAQGPLPLPWTPAPSTTVDHTVYTLVTWHGKPLESLPPEEAQRVLREAARSGWRLPGLRIEEEHLTLLAAEPGSGIVVLLPAEGTVKPLPPLQAKAAASRLGATRLYTYRGYTVALLEPTFAGLEAPALPPMGPRDRVVLALAGPWGTAVFRVTGSSLARPLRARAQPVAAQPTLWGAAYATTPGTQARLVDVVPWSDTRYETGQPVKPTDYSISLGRWQRWSVEHRAYTPPRTTMLKLTFVAASDKGSVFRLSLQLDGYTLLDPAAAVQPGARYIAQLVRYTVPSSTVGPEVRVRATVEALAQPVDIQARLVLAATSIAGQPTLSNAVAAAATQARGIVGVENGAPMVSSQTSSREATNPPIAIPTTGRLTVLLPIAPPVLDIGAEASATIACTQPIKKATMTVGDQMATCSKLDSHTVLCSLSGWELAQQLWRSIEQGQPLPVTVTVDPPPNKIYHCTIEDLEIRYKTRARAFRDVEYLARAFSSYPIDSSDFLATVYTLTNILVADPTLPQAGSADQYASATVVIYSWRPVPNGPLSIDLNIYSPAAGAGLKPLPLFNSVHLTNTRLGRIEGTILIRPVSPTDRPLRVNADDVEAYALGGGDTDERLMAIFSITSYALGWVSMIVSGGSAMLVGIAAQLIATPTLFYHAAEANAQAQTLPDGSVLVNVVALPDWRGRLEGVRIRIITLKPPTPHWHDGFDVSYVLTYRWVSNVYSTSYTIRSQTIVSGAARVPILSR